MGHQGSQRLVEVQPGERAWREERSRKGDVYLLLVTEPVTVTLALEVGGKEGLCIARGCLRQTACCQEARRSPQLSTLDGLCPAAEQAPCGAPWSMRACVHAYCND